MALFLGVVGSVGGINPTVALARGLMAQGHEVIFAINDKAKSFPTGEFTTTEFDITDPDKMTDMFAAHGPDRVICALSGPATFEHTAIKTAAARNIPVIVTPDAWGTVVRLPQDFKPSLVLCFDPVEHNFVTAAGIRSVMVGDSLFDRLTMIPDDVILLVSKLSNGGQFRRQVSILAGQKPMFTHLLADFVADSLKDANPEKHRIIVRAHPNMDASSKESWDRAVARIPEQCVVTIDPKRYTTDHLAAAADVAIAGFGTILRPSAHFGKVPLVVSYDEVIYGKDGMQNQMGFTEHPLVTARAALKVTAPITDLYAEKLPGRYKIEEYDLDLAVRSVLEI